MSDETSPKAGVVQAVGLAALSSVTSTITARVRRNLSAQHLIAAALFSRQVGEIERANAGQEYGAFFETILANANACVFASVASIESYINEFYIDRETHFPDFRKEVADSYWELFERKPILEKFELGLLLRNRPRLDRGQSATQNARVLISLRDALIHFKPEWDDELVKHDAISRQLRGIISPSPFLPTETAMFPLQWAGHSATSWAVGSAREYIKAFEVAADIPHRLEKPDSDGRLVP